MSSNPNKPGGLPRPAAGVPVDFEHTSDGASEAVLPPRLLEGKRLVLCVTGSIAAYKSVIVLRLLLKHGAKVKVVATRSAERFVQSSTFSALTGEPTLSDMFGQVGEPHIELTRDVDAVLVAPATADTLARLAHGHANDLVSALVLAADCPLVLAPAMHPNMWQHARTQHNILILASQSSVSMVGPVAGEVASGEVGMGRMAEPEDIVEGVVACLTPSDLEGRHVVVSAGPTREAIDPVRFLSNRSSGKMGFAIASRAARRGARVTLVTGPVDLKTPRGVQRVNVLSALEMREALLTALGANLAEADALIMAAAVADYRALEVSEEKLKRGPEELSLKLAPNPDILAEIGSLRPGKMPVLVGFALETEQGAQLIGLARGKLINKRVDLIVANGESALDGDENDALMVGVRDCVELGVQDKPVLAEQILNWVAAKWAQVESGEVTE